MTTKPCIIFPSGDRWFAWDEHGRLICHRARCGDLKQRLDELGYTIADHRSRFACNVRDRMRFRYPSLADAVVPTN